MDYVEPAEARHMKGLRLALTCHVPAPYSMSAKAIFDLKGVPYIPVAQEGAGSNEGLIAWTRHRNAPIAMYNDEAPRVGWLEILNLAERLGSGPSLIPDKIEERAAMIGLCNELIGENGLVWNMRLIMLGLGGEERAAKEAERNPMYAQYGYSELAKSQALERARTALAFLTKKTRDQKNLNSPYLIGDHLTAVDIYWVYFSQLLRTLPQEQCPTPAPLRKAYDLGSDALGEFDEILIEYRDRTLANHLPLPMEF
jgi:hypothetical protein